MEDIRKDAEEEIGSAPAITPPVDRWAECCHSERSRFSGEVKNLIMP
jgi:hypothetical protein